MRILKKASPLLLFLALMFSFSNANAQASKCYAVSPSTVSDIAQEIITDFSPKVLLSKTEIEDILLSEFNHPLNPDLIPPSPIITGNFAPHVLFRWDAIPGFEPTFVTNAYNLEISSQKVSGGQSPVLGTSYVLPAQEYHNLWMYSFYSAAAGDQSTLHVLVVDIIIIDKDVSYTCADIPSRKRLANVAPGIHISPNPFQNQVNVQFDLPEEGTTAIEVYDIMGQLVAQALAPQRLAEGAHQLEFNWDHLPAGTYTCLFRGPQRVRSQLMVKARD